MDVWLGGLNAVLNLGQDGVSPCSLLKILQNLLLTGEGGEVQKRHCDLFGRKGESPGYFFSIIGETSAPFYITLEPHLYIH